MPHASPTVVRQRAPSIPVDAAPVGDDMAALYAHAVRQPPALQAALIDGSAALRDYLGIGDAGGNAARIADSEAAAALAVAAAHSRTGTHVQRALARLDDMLAARPHAGTAHQQHLETVLGTLLPALHKLPTEAVRQQATALIAQGLFPQLHAEGQARMRARACAAMAQRGIGSALVQQLATMLPAARADRRGRAGFEAALRQHAPAGCNAGALPASTCIPFKAVQVECTRYARQAADLLVDSSGRLVRTHIAAMLKRLDGDTSVLDEHKAQLRNTLGALRYDRVLGATIDSICEQAPPSGGAADAVRASLNLPPDHALTKADARKAVVMSLLGYLRQGFVGSCYATAPAICLLESSPEAVAKDLKELLETNKLTFSQGNIDLEVPLNKHVQELPAHALVGVRADGTTLAAHAAANENGRPQDGPQLHEIAGMRAALVSLGIPEQERPAAVSAVLQRIRANGVDPAQGVLFQQLIDLMATAGVAPTVEPVQHAFREAHYVVTLAGHGRALRDFPAVQAALTAIGVPAERQRGFVAGQLQAGLVNEDGQLDLRALIHGLAQAVSDDYTANIPALASDGIDHPVKVQPNGKAMDGSGMYEIAAIRDALASLGIPKASWPATVIEALQRAFRSGIDAVKDGISCRQLIVHLAEGNPLRMEQIAIAAFMAKHNAVKVDAQGVLEDSTRLQDLPGIQAALGKLGIAEASWQHAVREALEGLVENNVNLEQAIPLGYIVTQLAGDPHEIADLRKRYKNALRAFNGTRDVSLLKTWEFTLAGASQLRMRHASHPTQWNLGQVSHAIFHGEFGEHKRSLELRAPGLYSLHDQAMLFVDGLQSDRYFEDLDLEDICNSVFSSMTSLMQNRFVYELDMNLKGDPSTDGVSTHGGFVLCEKEPADDPARWKRIDNAHAFMNAMERLVRDAVGNTRASIDTDDMPDDAELDALDEIGAFLAQSVGSSEGRAEFLKHALLLMNEDENADSFSMDKIDSYKRTPWKKMEGSYPDPIVAHYGGRFVRPARAQSGTDGAMSMVHSFCAGLGRMAPQLQAKAAQAPDGFKIPVALPGHVLTLMPMAMQEIWSGDPATRMSAEQWIDAQVRSPAARWRDEPRTLPELSAVLASAGTALGASEQDVQAMQVALTGQDGAYTLGAVYGALSAYCQTRDNGGALLAAAEKALMTLLPVPAKIIGDTNWMSAAGRPLHVGILHNPFTDKLDALKMHADGGRRMPLSASWTNPATFASGYPLMYTPMAKSRGGDQAESSGQKRKLDQR